MKEESSSKLTQQKQQQQLSARVDSNRSGKRNQSVPTNSGKQSYISESPQSRLRRQREKLMPNKLDKIGTVSSTLEPISEDKDEVLKSYSKLNFKDYSKARGFQPINNSIPRDKLTSQNQQRPFPQVEGSSAQQLKPEFKMKQRDLIEKMGKRIASKSKNRLQPEVVEEELPGRTMENWTQDLNSDTQSPNPKRLRPEQVAKDEDEDYPKIQLQGIEEGEIVLNKLTPNHRGAGSVGSKPSFATVQQLQSMQYGANGEGKTSEDDHGQFLKNRNLKNNSSSGNLSNQIIGSGRNKQRIYSSHSSKRPSNQKLKTINIVQDSENIIQEEEVLLMSKTGDKDAFSRTAKKKIPKANNLLPARSSSTNPNILPVRTSYNNGIIVLDNQRDQAQMQKMFSETLQEKIRQNQLVRQQQEIEARKLREAEQAKFAVDEQTRQLKKVLELAKSLNKKKDAAKISEMLQQMRDTSKPLPYSTVNELRKLELMESPYSQPLIGMIKEIEAQIQNRFGTGEGTKRNKRHKKSKQEFSENTSSNGGDLHSALGSRRQLVLIKGIQSSASRVQSQGSLGSDSGSSYHIVSQQPSLTKLQHQRQASVEDSPLKDDNGLGGSYFNIQNMRTSHQKTSSDPQLPQLMTSKHINERSNNSRPDTTDHMSQSSKNTNNANRRRNINVPLDMMGDGVVSPPFMNIEEDNPFSDPMSRRITMDPEQKKNITNARKQKLGNNIGESGKTVSIKFKIGQFRAGTSQGMSISDNQTYGFPSQKEKSRVSSLNPPTRNQRTSSKKKKRVVTAAGMNLPQTSQSYYSTINQILVEHEMEESVLEAGISSKKHSVNHHEISAADYEV